VACVLGSDNKASLSISFDREELINRLSARLLILAQGTSGRCCTVLFTGSGPPKRARRQPEVSLSVNEQLLGIQNYLADRIESESGWRGCKGRRACDCSNTSSTGRLCDKHQKTT